RRRPHGALRRNRNCQGGDRAARTEDAGERSAACRSDRADRRLRAARHVRGDSRPVTPDRGGAEALRGGHAGNRARSDDADRGGGETGLPDRPWRAGSSPGRTEGEVARDRRPAEGPSEGTQEHGGRAGAASPRRGAGAEDSAVRPEGGPPEEEHDAPSPARRDQRAAARGNLRTAQCEPVAACSRGGTGEAARTAGAVPPTDVLAQALIPSCGDLFPSRPARLLLADHAEHLPETTPALEKSRAVAHLQQPAHQLLVAGSLA